MANNIQASRPALESATNAEDTTAPTWDAPGRCDEKNISKNRVNIGVFYRLPDEVISRILSSTIPNHDCIQSPYDLHTCALSFGPELNAIAGLNESCKYFCWRTTALRVTASPFFRMEAAGLEYQFQTRSLGAQKSEQPVLEENLKRKKMERDQKWNEIKTKRRQRYGIDPTVVNTMDLPQFQQLHLSLNADDLKNLDDAALKKFWIEGKSHAFQITHLESDSQLVDFLSYHPQGLVALQLPLISETDTGTAVGAALTRCPALQYLIIQHCSPKLFESIMNILPLRHLKLEEPDFLSFVKANSAAKTATIRYSQLECLCIKTSEGKILDFFIGMLHQFPLLKDLRLQPQNFNLGENELNVILNSAKQLKHLECVEIYGFPSGQVEAIKNLFLARELKRLALLQSSLDEEEVTRLITGLSTCLSLRQLGLSENLRLSEEAALCLKEWLLQDSCRLQLLNLNVTTTRKAADHLIEGIAGNRSLDTLILNVSGDQDDSDRSDHDSQEDAIWPKEEALDHLGDPSVAWLIAEQIHLAKGLRSFQLRATNLAASRITDIAVAILDSKSLLEIDLRENAWDDAATLKFLAALHKNHVLLHALLPTTRAEDRRAIDAILQRNLRPVLLPHSAQASALVPASANPPNTALTVAGNTAATQDLQPTFTTSSADFNATHTTKSEEAKDKS